MSHQKKFLLLIFMLLSIVMVSAHDHDNNRFLIIHSYSPKFSWTRNIQEGIMDVLSQEKSPADYYVEYMDSYIMDNGYFGEDYYTFIKKKYEDIQFSGIILSDDNAVKFYIDQGQDLFPDAFVVACGVNSLEEYFKQSRVDAFILEEPDIPGSFKGISTILPSTNKVLTLLNRFSIIRILKSHLSGYMVHSNLCFIPEERTLLHRETPVFVCWDYQFGTGALGGSVLDSLQLGRNSMQTLLSLISGERINRYISQYKNMYKSVYDYRVMKKFGISKSQIPKGAEIINKPPSFLYVYRYVLVVLFIIIIFLVLNFWNHHQNIKKQIIINEQKEEILTLKEEYIDTQKELISTLGEVIEKRSKETSFHVRRVSILSGWLARMAGMEVDRGRDPGCCFSYA